MSGGPRLALRTARTIAERLMQRWSMSPATCFIVGSIRRQAETVADIDLVAPLPASPTDILFNAINATVTEPWSDPKAGLFARQLVRDSAFCKAVSGLKPGFKALSLRVVLKSGGSIACQVFRYTPENFGWMMVEKTGPAEFGKWFLGRWKVAHGIPTGREDAKASIDNHLVNAGGVVVPVLSEEEAFDRAKLQWIPPEAREEFIERARARAGGGA